MMQKYLFVFLCCLFATSAFARTWIFYTPTKTIVHEALKDQVAIVSVDKTISIGDNTYPADTIDVYCAGKIIKLLAGLSYNCRLKPGDIISLRLTIKDFTHGSR